MNVQSGLVEGERKFLISSFRSQRGWNPLGIQHLAELPGIRWKLHNLAQLARLSSKKFVTQAEAFERLLWG